MGLPEFQSNHNGAHCVSDANNHTTCYQWENVSLAAVSAKTAQDCTFDQHTNASRDDCREGMVADFEGIFLTKLTYVLGFAGYDDIKTALRNKFGPPSFDTGAREQWTDGTSRLNFEVVETKSTSGGVPTKFLRLTLGPSPPTSKDEDL
jgi:hypothetical protein